MGAGRPHRPARPPRPTTSELNAADRRRRSTGPPCREEVARGRCIPQSPIMTLKLLLSGDSILQRRLQSRSDPELSPLFDRVRAADVAFTNLEVLANDYRGDPALESGGSHFGAPSWVLDELVEAGFALFATATNHSLDYSISGLLHSIEAMERRGLSFAGTGRNLEDARRPCYHTHPAGTVAMLSCASSFAKGNEAAAQRHDMPGRPGLNPLHFETVHEVSEAQLAAL